MKSKLSTGQAVSAPLRSAMSCVWLLSILTAVVYFGVKENGEAIAGVFAVGILGILTINIDRVTSFKLLGNEAHLSDIVDEANDVMDRTRKLAETVTKITLADMGMGNFMSGLPVRLQFEFRCDIVRLLSELGVENERFANIELYWVLAVRQMYHDEIDRSLPEAIKSKFGTDFSEEKERKTTYEFEDLSNLNRLEVPTSSELETWLNRNELWSVTIERTLSEMRNFEKDGTVPEQSVLFRGESEPDISLVRVFRGD